MIDEERFQRDLRAFQIITPLFVNLGYELLKKVKVIELLKNEKSIEELSAEASVRNVALLETILDILVGAKVLNFSKNKYKYAMPPKKMRAEDMEFLNKHYGRSLEWVNKLIKSSDGCLLHNKCDFSLGFEGEKMLDLWDDIMNESPYSLRKYAISLFNEKLQGKEKILDYGCGGGIALEQILLSVDKEITLYGMDPSKKYLNRAKKRIDNLQKKTKDKLVLENIKRMRFIHLIQRGEFLKMRNMT